MYLIPQKIDLSLTILITCMAFLTPSAQAIEDYKCKISSFMRVDDQTGLMKSLNLSDWLVSDEFVVDTETGRMVGAIKNHGSGGQPEIITKASGSMAFKAMTEYGPVKSVQLFRINEFVKQPNKPFIYWNRGDIYSGLCTRY